jgi:hypothetical protein
VETLEAEVTGVETLRRDDVNERVLKVEFRAQAGPGVPEEARLQAIAWVRADDGLVLRQDVYISGSQLRFERLSEDEAAEVGRQLLLDQRRYGRYGRPGGPRWMRPRNSQRPDLRRENPEFEPRARLERGEGPPPAPAGEDRPTAVD